MMIRLSISSLAGTSRTVVAVGMDSEASMFFATARDMPRSGVTLSSSGSEASFFLDFSGSEGTGVPAGALDFLTEGDWEDDGDAAVCAAGLAAGPGAAFGAGFAPEAVAALAPDCLPGSRGRSFTWVAVEVPEGRARSLDVPAPAGDAPPAGPSASRRSKISTHFASTEDLSALYLS